MVAASAQLRGCGEQNAADLARTAHLRGSSDRGPKVVASRSPPTSLEPRTCVASATAGRKGRRPLPGSAAGVGVLRAVRSDLELAGLQALPTGGRRKRAFAWLWRADRGGPRSNHALAWLQRPPAEAVRSDLELAGPQDVRPGGRRKRAVAWLWRAERRRPRSNRALAWLQRPRAQSRGEQIAADLARTTHLRGLSDRGPERTTPAAGIGSGRRGPAGGEVRPRTGRPPGAP